MNARSTASLERRERERAETRRKILEAARRTFVQQGYERTTMRAIAAKIGYTPTAIYHHFKDKDALVAELSALDFRALSQALRQTGSVADPVERLEKIGQAYVEFALTHPMPYQFLFMTRRPTDAGQEAMPGDPGEDAYGFLRQTCADVIATGRLRPEFTDADELAQMAWGSLHGLVALQIAKGNHPAFRWRDVRQTAAKIRDVTIRGTLREPTR
ncbi:MAG TPA: TetR/AcrR family transcriptional regulator [Gemmatimonadales bacterium]|nr:TetR/AcrR family transcriptional regulator [Gemmatimonadales bacterium]